MILEKSNLPVQIRWIIWFKNQILPGDCSQLKFIYTLKMFCLSDWFFQSLNQNWMFMWMIKSCGRIPIIKSIFKIEDICKEWGRWALPYSFFINSILSIIIINEKNVKWDVSSWNLLESPYRVGCWRNVVSMGNGLEKQTINL